MHSRDSIPLRAATRQTSVRCGSPGCDSVIARLDPRAEIEVVRSSDSTLLEGKCRSCSVPFAIPIRVRR